MAQTVQLGPRRLGVRYFITYRTDTTGSVSCGPLKPAVRALVANRPTATTSAAGSIDDDAVAIELLPDDYQPEAVVR
jgi:hypothetical protein